MKNIFKAFIIMILAFVLCIPMQIIVKASTYTNLGSKKDVVVTKPWTVSFNKPLSATTVNTTNIKVIGENNKYVDIKVSLANNNKDVIVQAIKNYEYSKPYTLIVTEKVRSVDGKPLTSEVRMNFNTQSAPVLKIASVQDIMTNLEEGSKYTFPKTVQATMSDNSKKEVQVEWLQDFVNLDKSGAYTYEGTIKNYDKKVKAIIQVSKKQASKFIVCINAARGGSDSGSVGPTGLKEKDVNLDVALRLGKLLQKENVQVVYTRSGDSVTWNSSNEIQERINIANNAKADLLITISCNSYTSEATNGIETFYLKGNAKGKQLAEYIQSQLISKTAALDRGIKESDFNSLKLSNAPGAMAALGFITNKSEESKLKTSEYKDKLALAFTEAVKKYISLNPQNGSGDGNTSPGNIYINDITENVKKNDKYTLPLIIKVTTDSGTEKEVDVVWDIKSLDTNKVGVYAFQGTIKESTKKVSLVVNVIETTKTNYKVVLDAGHGGFDPGAAGPTGINEKSVTLAVTLKVGSILAKNGVETIYTRTSDNITWSTNETQNLQARCDISNKAKPDYFVSIHANSATAAAVGIETYYYGGNQSGAKLAQAVQTELIKETGKSNRGIKTANFYVLRNMDATAILVETSFISNPVEEKLLASEDYQNKLAKAISTGILKSLGISNIVF
ncbi:N-acetylmuramoyl-L-alanine amidase [Clostridium sp. CS001]|jgi:N-acetylmuramoyl-L-alanine amidase|uniref:N-acetylmuramoyl-L-alanine amidase n=1 Tax=Clostridium sp. CS001 TaxID=2880648 RepID=UPI001CF3063D|nr:N-acetylmuramoyl-L-alanine amidase [Clostridium sp. CS001]MCB2290174.1 N-acetylmuramoyl-L-alanine amidase [Clostridium sp. CS001]